MEYNLSKTKGLGIQNMGIYNQILLSKWLFKLINE
jgi:hypothetical protein